MNANAEKVLKALKEKGLTCGFAESLTGGLISAELVEIPGASEVFDGSVVSYSNSVKINVLGVAKDVIESVGAVSEECAKQMAAGTLRVIGCDVAVSATGIAGPAGGSEKKPVGTVYLGVAVKDKVYACHNVFDGDREQIRQAAVNKAYGLLLEAVGENF